MELLAPVESKCVARYVKISPLKVKRILDQIRGRSYKEALVILNFMPYKACSIILKVLRSAASNCKQIFDLEESLLFIKEARVDKAPFLKRVCPHAQGRAFPIKKHYSHITSFV